MAIFWSTEVDPPEEVRAVLFDAGLTLIKPVRTVERIYAQYARSSGIPVAELVPQIRHHFAELFGQARQDMASGADGYVASDEADRAMWRRLCFGVAERIPGLTEDPEQWFEDLYGHFGEPSTWQMFDDARPTLQELSQRGLRLGIVSNWDTRLLRILEGLDFGVSWEAVMVSAQVGVRKPGPRIFELAMESLQVDPRHTVMVGDSVTDDIHGARAAGLTGVLIHRAEADPPPDVPAVTSLQDLLELVRAPE